MSEIFFSYQDVRKIATVFRRPDISLIDCVADAGQLTLRFRIDAAQLVEMIRRFKDHFPVEAAVKMELQLLDSQRIGVQLVDMDVDAKAIPKFARKLAMPMIRRSLFDRIPPMDGVCVEKDKERVIVDVAQVLKASNVGAPIEVKRLKVEQGGIRILIAIGAGDAAC